MMSKEKEGRFEGKIFGKSEQDSQPLDLSNAGGIVSLPNLEDEFGDEPLFLPNNEAEDFPDGISDVDMLFHNCPVLKEERSEKKITSRYKRNKKSHHHIRHYRSKKRRKKKKDLNRVDDVPPPDLIPEIEIQNSCTKSSRFHESFNIKISDSDKSDCSTSLESKFERLPSTPPDRPILENIKALGKRGNNGWEDCLRPRPPQVEHFQSLMMMELRNEKREKKDRSDMKKMRSVSQQLNFEDKLVHNQITRYLMPQSVSSVETMDEAIEDKTLLPSKRYSKWMDKRLMNKRRSSIPCQRLESNQGSRSENMSKKTEQSQDESSNTTEAAVGEIVWAKLGCTRWWPAMVVWGDDCGQVPARIGQIWVFWFGDHKISELPNDKLLDFVKSFKSKYSDLPGKTFRRGVVEAVKEIAVRAEVLDLVADTELIQWAKQGFPVRSSKEHPYSPDPGNPYPESVRSHLARIKDLYLQAIEADAKLAQQTRSARQEQLENKDSMLKKVWNGDMDIKDVCISCDSADVKVTHQHPLFEGGLCKQCKDEITDTIFAYGDDGTNAYCVICGNAGILLICDNSECNRCYCTGCIEILVSVEAREKAEATEPWLCYLCQDSDDNGLIKRKLDWQQNIVALFQPENNIQLPSMEAYSEKRPIRVFSLFDGIGTCKLVLDQLGFDLEVYYASEIEADAKNVVAMHYMDEVTHVGDIEQLTDQQVAKLCPLDLIIGGSPCNDLSLVNPARKGLYDPTGTGRLFFDFFRVLKTVQLANQGRHVFWLYENVASMPQEYRHTINRFLQCEPSMIDSKYFSPQNRARYFWGNIPGMYSPLQPHITEQCITLDSVLTPFCNRIAQVEKIRTVTTRSNSLKQGKMAIHPVQMNGENDVLWVTELEQVFGFPKHYTDVGNIPLGRRQQLLGKAWSVPVIKHLLTPLKNFFKIRTNHVSTGVQTSSSTTANNSPSTSDSTAITSSPNHKMNSEDQPHFIDVAPMSSKDSNDDASLLSDNVL